MEQLIRFLPLIIGGLQQVPEVRNLIFSLMPGQQPTAPAPPDVVRLVQILLNLFGGENLRVDGIYGPGTQAAVARAAAKMAAPLQKQL